MTNVFTTSEGAQEMRPRSELTATELLREVGAVLRMSEAEAAALGDLPVDPDEDQTMIINMGPQHPSTHGVLRLMLELQGETVLRCKPVIGYLHTGMEKTGEEFTYLQGPTNTTRMDYASPLFNELVFSMATEQLLGIDGDIPERAVWIRMLMAELNRMSSHLLFLATNGMDLGAVSMMIYGWREREEVLRFFQEVTGLRMNHNYIRPGGVAADLPPGWRDSVAELLEVIPVAHQVRLCLAKRSLRPTEGVHHGVERAGQIAQLVSRGNVDPAVQVTGLGDDLGLLGQPPQRMNHKEVQAQQGEGAE